MLPALTIFALTYVLISARRLAALLHVDRSAAALLGAVACVVFGLIGPDRAIAAVDGRTLLLLFGMMGMGACLDADGFFQRAVEQLARRFPDPRRLLAAIVWGSGSFAALLTNDAVCVLGTPVVVGLIRTRQLPALPFLLALATAANTGSAATLVGNPQNMLCANLGGLAYLDHLILVGPVALIALAVNHGLLLLGFRRALAETPRLPAPNHDHLPLLDRQTLPTVAIVAGTALLYSLGFDLAWTATAGALAAMLIRRHAPGELWLRVDWSVLLFFAGLFVVVTSLVASGAPAALFDRFPLWTDALPEPWAWARLAGLALIGSNLVSNVPFILVVAEPIAALPDPRLGWEMLAMASTFAGNLTLLGSVANIIVAEKSREVGGVGFVDYLRIGVPLTLISTAIGVAWLCWLAG
ncbi:SLC13 family permease [Nannocystaceae bacterium ST9]